MIISFFGHSSLYATKELSKRVSQTIKQAIEREEKITFYCGGYGDFDAICAEVCRAIKKDHPLCEAVFVTPYMTEAQQRKIKELMNSKLYDSCVYPPLENVPPRFAIIKRNEWMVEKADLIIAYVECSFGGAYKALQYARKKGKQIINLAEKEG